MAIVDSGQMAKLNAVPVQHIRSDEHGRVRRVWFAFEPTIITGATDTINLCRLPPGARFMSGKLYWEASTATAEIAIGIAGSTAKYSGIPILLTSKAIQPTVAGVAGGFDLCGTASGGTIAAPVVGESLSGPTTVIGTMSVAGAAANKRITGYLDYLGNE